MTEEEAKTKWCFHFTASHSDPRARQWLDGDQFNGSGPLKITCLGSECMAWRWLTVPAAAHVERARGADVLDPTLCDQPVPAVVGDGFCGLADQP